MRFTVTPSTISDSEFDWRQKLKSGNLVLIYEGFPHNLQPLRFAVVAYVTKTQIIANIIGSPEKGRFFFFEKIRFLLKTGKEIDQRYKGAGMRVTRVPFYVCKPTRSRIAKVKNNILLESAFDKYPYLKFPDKISSISSKNIKEAVDCIFRARKLLDPSYVIPPESVYLGEHLNLKKRKKK